MKSALYKFKLLLLVVVSNQALPLSILCRHSISKSHLELCGRVVIYVCLYVPPLLITNIIINKCVSLLVHTLYILYHASGGKDYCSQGLSSPPLQRDRGKKDPVSGWSRVLVTNLSSWERSQFIIVLLPLLFVTYKPCSLGKHGKLCFYFAAKICHICCFQHLKLNWVWKLWKDNNVKL